MCNRLPSFFSSVPSLFFDFVDLGLDFPGQTSETPDPGPNLGVSYSKHKVYTTALWYTKQKIKHRRKAGAVASRLLPVPWVLRWHGQEHRSTPACQQPSCRTLLSPPHEPLWRLWHLLQRQRYPLHVGRSPQPSAQRQRRTSRCQPNHINLWKALCSLT